MIRRRDEEKEISREKVKGVIKKLKDGKTTGMDGILRCGGMEGGEENGLNMFVILY